MSDNVQFQSATPATPPVATTVATDYAPSSSGSAHYQIVKLNVGPDGTFVPLAWGGTGMPLGTLPGGTIQAVGGFLGTTGAGLGKREDTVHVDGDVGVSILGVRRDTATTEAADGEYTAITTDSAGRLRVNVGPSLVDTGNSSTTTLAGNAVFTGTALDVTEYASITVTTYSNVASATDGLQLQFSPDGTNWDFTLTATAAAATATTIKSGILARYMRVIYTNGGSAQGSFRLQTIVKASALSVIAKPISDNLASIDIGQVTKAVLAGRIDGGNSYRNVDVANAAPTASVYGLIVRVAGTVNTLAAGGTQQILGTVQTTTPTRLGTAFAASSAGTTVVLAAQSGTRWRITSEFVSANGSVNTTWLSMGAGGTTAISGTFFSAVSGNGLVRPASPPGGWYYQTAVGSALGFFLSLGTATGVDITYEAA